MAYGRENQQRLDKFRAFLDTKRRPFRPSRTLEEHFKSTAGMGKNWE